MALRIGGSAEFDKYRNILGQQQRPQPSTSIPMGGFMGQNQIGGQSAINIYRTPPTPAQIETQQFEDRAGQYQQDLAKFNLGQREAKLKSQRAGAEEIASGRFMLNGQAVSRAEYDQYQRGVEESGAIAQADFDRENPFYAAVKASMEPSPTRIKDIFGRFSESEDAYSDRLEEYLSPANKQAREQQFSQSLNDSRTSALRNSINQFRDNPMSYLMGGGEDGSTYSPDALMGYLGKGSQLFKATGQEGNFMDFILGSSAAPSGVYQPAPSGVYQPGTSYASQGFTPETAKASMMGGSSLSNQDEMRQFNLDTFQRAAPGIDFPSNY